MSVLQPFLAIFWHLSQILGIRPCTRFCTKVKQFNRCNSDFVLRIITKVSTNKIVLPKKNTIKLAKIRTLLQNRFQPIAQVIKLIHTGQNWGMKYTEYRYKAKRLTTCIMLQFKFSKNATKKLTISLSLSKSKISWEISSIFSSRLRKTEHK